MFVAFYITMSNSIELDYSLNSDMSNTTDTTSITHNKYKRVAKQQYIEVGSDTDDDISTTGTKLHHNRISDNNLTSKQARRRQQNRAAAATSRHKKKSYIQNLELQINELLTNELLYKQRINELEIQNQLLKQQLPGINHIDTTEPMIKLESTDDIDNKPINDDIVVHEPQLLSIESYDMNRNVCNVNTSTPEITITLLPICRMGVIVIQTVMKCIIMQQFNQLIQLIVMLMCNRNNIHMNMSYQSNNNQYNHKIPYLPNNMMKHSSSTTYLTMWNQSMISMHYSMISIMQHKLSIMNQFNHLITTQSQNNNNIQMNIIVNYLDSDQ